MYAVVLLLTKIGLLLLQFIICSRKGSISRSCCFSSDIHGQCTGHRPSSIVQLQTAIVSIIDAFFRRAKKNMVTALTRQTLSKNCSTRRIIYYSNRYNHNHLLWPRLTGSESNELQKLRRNAADCLPQKIRNVQGLTLWHVWHGFESRISNNLTDDWHKRLQLCVHVER